MNTYTYNQITDIFRNFADNHSQVNSFYSGEISNLKGNIIYPLMVLNIDSTQFLPNQVEYKINVLLLDRINPERENQDEVNSDTQQIIGDLISYLKNSGAYDLIVDLNSNVQRVSDEVNSDWVSGWVLNLSIRTKFDYNVCTIPGIIPPIAFTGNTPTSVQTPVFLTCNTLLSCSSLQNVLATKANLSGASFSNYLFTPSITGTTFYSGSTPLSNIIQSIANTFSASSYVNEFFESGSTGSMSFQLKNSFNSTNGNSSFALGNANTTNGTYCNILNGAGSRALSNRATVINGSVNIAGTGFSLVGNGKYNYVMYNAGSSNAGYYSSILNGIRNYVTSYRSMIGTGYYNKIIDGGNATVLNGTRNWISGGTAYCTILNGYSNRAYSAWSLIGNGNGNKIFGSYATILNGKNNLINQYSTNSAILCGTDHTVNAGVNNSAIIGGSNITASVSNTVYVPNLNINSITGVNYSLYIDATGRVYSSPSAQTGSNSATALQNGINTYTGGTAGNPSVNVTALTISNITVSGLTDLKAVTATQITGTSFISGATNLNNLFLPVGSALNQLVNTAHTHSINEVINLQSVLNTKSNLSGATFTGGVFATTLSGGTLYSGSTELGSLFPTKNNRSIYSQSRTASGSSSVGSVQVVYSVLIPANSLSVGDSIDVTALFNFNDQSASNKIGRIYLSSGATNLTVAATSSDIIWSGQRTAALQTWQAQTKVYVTGSTGQIWFSNANQTTSMLNESDADTPSLSLPLNSDMYVLFACSKPTATGSTRVMSYDVFINKA